MGTLPACQRPSEGRRPRTEPVFARDRFPRLAGFPFYTPPLHLLLSHVPNLCLGLVAGFSLISVFSRCVSFDLLVRAWRRGESLVSTLCVSGGEGVSLE